MADKMMRMAGRGFDGNAKALKTNNDGVVLARNYRETYDLTSTDITLPAGTRYTLTLDNPPESFSLSGLINTSIGTVEVSFQDLVDTNVVVNDYNMYYCRNRIFVTNTYNSKSDRIQIVLRNPGSTELVISKIMVVASDRKDTEIISEKTYRHEDLFNYDTSGNTTTSKGRMIYVTDTKPYKQILMYVDHNFEVGFDLNVYDTLGKIEVFKTSGFDGENFVDGNWSSTIEIPNSAAGGSDVVVRYPVHITREIFNFPIVELQTRISPKSVQTRKTTANGKTYFVRVTIVGVK